MNSKKWETFYAVLLNIFVNCIAQEISCNEFGFFCADRIRFGNCIDYTNGTMSADVSFLIECPENTYCNIESVSICKEVTENTLQVSTTPSTGTRTSIGTTALILTIISPILREFWRGLIRNTTQRT